MAKQSAAPRKGAAKKTSKTNNKNTPALPEQKPVRRLVGAFIFLFLGLFSVIGYFDTQAWFIVFLSSLIKGLFGWGFYIFPPALFLSAWIFFSHKGRPVRLRTVCAMLLPLVAGVLVHLWFCKLELESLEGVEVIKTLYTTGAQEGSGGVLSGLFAIAFKSMLTVYGATPVFILALVALAVIALNIKVAEVYERFKNRPRRVYEPEPEPEFEPQPEPDVVPARRRSRAIDIPMGDADDDEVRRSTPPASEPAQIGFFNNNPRVKTPDEVLAENRSDYEASFKRRPASRIDIPVDEPPFAPERVTEPEERVVTMPAVPASAVEMEPVVEEFSDPPRAEPPARKIKKEEVAAERENVARTIETAMSAQNGEYNFPALDLLRQGGAMAVDGREEIALNRERLDTTMRSFGVAASITNVTRGPTVTRYDMKLESGVKLSKLTNLAGDIALSLGVSGVRISPIPDIESTVGIEVPNKLVSTVYLRDIVASNEFQKAPSRLTFAIGKDIGGNAIVGNIAKLPHMLIAGTTGSGKSVCMNSLILSLLYKATPDEVRLIMIDPKMVELGIYNGIPHLFIPVVTDPKKAAGALQWAVVEMLRRYRMFSEAGVRDLAGYNQYQKRNDGDTLQQIVIVIDELADLMLVASKEVEESICRVAQMGRASGMHLIIATQRPSSDVITGLMKANIPSRIAFAVSSAMESRIILDASGAEKLVGAGDMLYSPIGSGKPQRIQGAFVSDEEREEVVNFVKRMAAPAYDEEILSQIERAAEEKGPAVSAEKPDRDDLFADYDELLTQAVDVILEVNQASVSLLQRRLKLGYARAARIVDQMEEIGVVGPFEGSKPRQILMTRAEWQQTKLGKTAEPGILDQIPLDDGDYEEDDIEDDGEYDDEL